VVGRGGRRRGGGRFIVEAGETEDGKKGSTLPIVMVTS